MYHVSIDFETYYDDVLSLKKLGTWQYVFHPDVSIYLMSIDAEDFTYSGPVEEFKDWDKLHRKDAVLFAHNMGFDGLCIKRLIQEGLAPSWLSELPWACTADLSVYFSGPRSLKAASKVFLKQDASKEYRKIAKGKGRREDFSDEEWAVVLEAGLQDARLCRGLADKLYEKWPEKERTISRLNREGGWKGVAVDEPALDAAIEHVQQVLDEASVHIPWKWRKTHKTPLSPKMIKQQCDKDNLWIPSSFAQDSDECLKWEEDYAEFVPWIDAVRIWRKGNPFLNKLQTVKDRLVTEDGNRIFKFGIKYGGAHTLRFSGSGGFNMQNIYGDERFGVVFRNLFIPRKGKIFCIADYNQIEAVLLNWVVDNEKLLEEYANGRSVYEAYAIANMGYEPQEKPLKELNPKMYKAAKASVLGGGYGAGTVALQRVAATLAGVIWDLEEAEEAKTAFRKSNPGIVKLWLSLDADLRDAVKKKSKKFQINLPTGRALRYFNPRITTGKITVTDEDGKESIQVRFVVKASVTAGHPPVKLWGGVLTENLIQALARDVLCDGWIRLYEALFDVLWTVHDEFVVELDKDGTQKQKKEEIVKLISQTPFGCPMQVDADLEERYVKG